MRLRLRTEAHVSAVDAGRLLLSGSTWVQGGFDLRPSPGLRTEAGGSTGGCQADAAERQYVGLGRALAWASSLVDCSGRMRGLRLKVARLWPRSGIRGVGWLTGLIRGAPRASGLKPAFRRVAEGKPACAWLLPSGSMWVQGAPWCGCGCEAGITGALGRPDAPAPCVRNRSRSTAGIDRPSWPEALLRTRRRSLR